jgi:uncharacterized membrane protein YvlD (DUF360 family)
MRRARAGGRLLLVWLVDVLALAAVAWALPGLELDGWRASVLAVGVIALLNALVRPLLLLLTLPLTLATFGVWSVMLSAVTLVLTAALVPGFAVRDWPVVLLAPVALALVNAAATSALRLEDDDAVFRELAGRLARRRRGARARRRARDGADPHADHLPLSEACERAPGLLIVEIDGLSAGAFERAVRRGDLPTLGAWIASGTHRLLAWDCGLPSQTSSSQAGLLWGTCADIPAFRWYEKRRGALMVSGRPADAACIERRLADPAAGGTPLLAGGASHCNMFTGGAERAVLTVSTLRWLGPGLRGRARNLYGYFLNPYHFARALGVGLGVVGHELLVAGWRRLRRDPAASLRGGAFALKRAVAAVLLRDVATQLLLEDVAAGVPVSYATFAGYDVVAHNTGPDSSDARRVLRDLDRRVGQLARAAAGGARPYQLVVLSDHGQSPGASFRARFGTTLEALVRGAIATRSERDGARATVLGSAGSDEMPGHVEALIRALGPWSLVERRARRAHVAGSAPTARTPADVVVCTSGNLGLVYFPDLPGRASLEAIVERHPTLLDALVSHPGIGFVLAHSEGHLPVVLGREGAHELSTGRIVGLDPLAPYGPYAAHALRRLGGFASVGDLVVNGVVDSHGQVAPFEEQVGSHGGLGGEQTDAFLLAPAALLAARSVPHTLVGPVAVHHVLRAWVPSERRGEERVVASAGDL